MAAVAERLPFETAAPLPRWPRSRAAVLIRRALQAALLFPLVRRLCRPLRVEGARRLRQADGPFVFVANHESHADTAVVLAALPREVRSRSAPAAAEDYFFSSRVRGVMAALAMGAFPFPRHGSAGLERAERLLAEGWNVLLFPEGTRSRDGRMGRFRPGAGHLSSRGATVVSVGLAGAREILPRRARLPRRAPVSIVFGEPQRTERGLAATEIAARLERRVSRLRASAMLLRQAPGRPAPGRPAPGRPAPVRPAPGRPAPGRPAIERAGERAQAFARSRAGLWVAFGWGVAEALVWPIVPDIPVALLAAAAPSRFLPLVLAATAGSLAGGTIAYGLGAVGAGAFLLMHAPLVTRRMSRHALAQMSAQGASPLLGQPWTGIPYKVFSYQAPGAGVGFVPFMAASLLGRGHRILLVGVVFALGWLPFHRFAPRWARRAYAPFAVAFAAIFVMGLSRVVSAWS